MNSFRPCRSLSLPATLRLFAACLIVSLCALTLEAQEERRVKHILVGSEEAARTVRQEIMDAGGDRKAFTASAREKSKDATTRILGGDLGWVGMRSGFDPIFTKATFDLNVDTVSEPVQTEFGWHLIYVVETREKTPVTPTPPPPPPGTATTPPGTTTTPPTAGPTDLVPEATDEPTDPEAGGAPTTPTTPGAAAQTAEETAVEAKRRTLSANKAFRLSLETVKSSNLFRNQTFARDEAVEVNATIKNESAAAQEIFSPQLLPLGLLVREVDGVRSLSGDFTSLEEPANFLHTLDTYEIAGVEFSLNDFFSDLGKGRYTLSWSIAQFFNQLESRFPAVKALPDYESLKSGLQAAQTSFTVDVVTRDLSARARFRRRQGLDFAIYDRLERDASYYARIKIVGETEPVVIRLETQKQFVAANHFANLVLTSFYDDLDFFEVQPGDYVLGGDPESPRNGTGGPTGLMMPTRNIGQLAHEKGTVSFVTRGLRGPARGGQIGSIFFVCLTAHPEWDDEHVPFGQVVSGLEILEKQQAGSTVRFETVTLLSEAEYEGPTATPGADAADTLTQASSNPRAVLKTAKGELTVELYEDTSPNTVANFITLAEDDFFDGQTFYQIVKDEGGKPVAIITGNPAEGSGPGYTIADEVADGRKCVRGALVMVKRWDDESNNYEPNSAGSQYFICLDAIPYYDSLRQFTIFGQVTGGLEVLDALAEGDEVTSVEITQKRETPYTVRKNS